MDESGDTAYVTISQPGRQNALSWWLQRELGATLDRLATSTLRFVVLRGDGGNFSSGGDLTEVGGGTLPTDWLADYSERIRSTVLRMRTMPQIVVAAVRGAAVGAGASLALAADIVVAEAAARFRFSFVHMGAVPDAGAAVALGRAAGAAVTRDLLLTGRWLPAGEARAVGLVARTCPDGALDTAVEDILLELRQATSPSLSLTKRMIDDILTPDYGAAVLRDGVYQRAAFPRPSTTGQPDGNA